MSANLKLKTTELIDIIHPLDELKAQTLNHDHIFELKQDFKSLGFVSLYDLKEFQQSTNFDFTDYEIRGNSDFKFKKFYEHPYFQRRKPQLVSSESLIESDDEEYYLLTKGQKNGPYNFSELKELIETKNVLITDLVSLNAGHTWTKIYQLENFDRRSLKINEELPGLPSIEDLKDESEEISSSMPPETEAIMGLAYLGNLKRGKAIERQKEEHFEEEIKKHNSGNLIYKLIFIGSMIGIVYLGIGLKKVLLDSPFKNDTPAVGEQESSDIDETLSLESSTGDESAINIMKSIKKDQGGPSNIIRSNRMEGRKLEPIRPNRNKSFTDTNKFRNSTNAPFESEHNDSYYYSESAPIELDPVQSQVSRETMNPENPVGMPGPVPSNDPLFNQEIDN